MSSISGVKQSSNEQLSFGTLMYNEALNLCAQPGIHTVLEALHLRLLHAVGCLWSP